MKKIELSKFIEIYKTLLTEAMFKNPNSFPKSAYSRVSNLERSFKSGKINLYDVVLRRTCAFYNINKITKKTLLERVDTNL